MNQPKTVVAAARIAAIAAIALVTACTAELDDATSELDSIDDEYNCPSQGHTSCCEDNRIKCVVECSRCYGQSPPLYGNHPDNEACYASCNTQWQYYCRLPSCTPTTYEFCPHNNT